MTPNTGAILPSSRVTKMISVSLHEKRGSIPRQVQTVPHHRHRSSLVGVGYSTIWPPKFVMLVGIVNVPHKLEVFANLGKVLPILPHTREV